MYNAEIEIEIDASKIPSGLYCYTLHSVNRETGRMNITPCPFWGRQEDKPEQESGYCSFLKKGDWQPGLTFLWDMVKECDINTETPEG